MERLRMLSGPHYLKKQAHPYLPPEICLGGPSGSCYSLQVSSIAT